MNGTKSFAMSCVRIALNGVSGRYDDAAGISTLAVPVAAAAAAAVAPAAALAAAPAVASLPATALP